MSYHINPTTGVASQCSASEGRCPFGPAEEHHATVEAAREHYELLMSSAALPKPLSAAVPVPEVFYHVTTRAALPSILREGLVPRTGERSALLGEAAHRVYMFDSRASMEDAVGSWLGEEFEDEELVLLSVPADQVPAPTPSFDDPEGSFEWSTSEAIPAAALRVEEDDLG